MMEQMISMTLTLNLPKIQAKGPYITTAYILYVLYAQTYTVYTYI